MDWDAEGLLDGLEGQARAARARLLDELCQDGVEIGELRRAIAEDRLVLLPVERALTGRSRLTAAEVAQRADVELDWLLRINRAAGFATADPQERAYSDEDVEGARRVRSYVELGLPEEDVLAITRLMSSGVARSAEAMQTVFAGAFLQPGDDEHELSRRFAAMAEHLVPQLARDLEFLLRAHLRDLSRQAAIGFAERRAGRVEQTTEMAVAFADLVGFTRLGEELSEEDLGVIADRLTRLAQDHLRPPVRIVKTLGDAVMLVSRECGPLVAVVLDLVDAAEATDGMPELRAGAAWGPCVARYGDWYGGTVNLASRLAGRARPGALLVDARLREAAGDENGLDWSRAGDKKLKNVSSAVETWRVRRTDG